MFVIVTCDGLHILQRPMRATRTSAICFVRFTAISTELASQITEASKAHHAWPELLRRVARELKYPTSETLAALHAGDYAVRQLV